MSVYSTYSTDMYYIVHWFLTSLEVLNPISSIHAFIEPFVDGKNKMCVVNFFKNFYSLESFAVELLKLTDRC